jgi:hypothetical protein
LELVSEQLHWLESSLPQSSAQLELLVEVPTPIPKELVQVLWLTQRVTLFTRVLEMLEPILCTTLAAKATKMF